MLEVRRKAVNSSCVLYKITFRGRWALNVLKFETMTREASRSATPYFVAHIQPLISSDQGFFDQQSGGAGEWGPGDAIPSEGELAARFNVSQGTVRKAIDEMAAENMLVRRQGKGTFVSTHSDPRSFYRFLRLVPDAGGVAHTVSDPLSCVIHWRQPSKWLLHSV